MRTFLLLLAAGALSACSADQFATDGDAGTDAASLPDAVSNDGSSLDAPVHSDGGTVDASAPPAWKPVALPGNPSQDLNAVWGSSYDDVWVVGAGGYAAHWNGNAFESNGSSGQPVAGNDLFAVWGRGSNEAMAAGKSGTLVHYMGNGPWTSYAGGALATKTVTGVWGTLASGGYYLQTLAGQQFLIDPSVDSSAKDINNQFSGTNACAGMHKRIAACEGGIVLDPDVSAGWVHNNAGTPDFFGVWALPAVYVLVGAGGTIAYTPAATPNTLLATKPGTEDLHGVWIAEGGQDGFAVGDKGQILRGDATTHVYAIMPSSSSANLRGVFGVKDTSQKTHVFAVGAGGTVLKLDL